MIRPIILTASVLAGMSLNAAEVRSADHYQSIIDRNSFGLKEPTPTQTVKPIDNVQPEKKTEFYLTGISTIGFPKKPKKAYLLNKDNSKKDYSEKYLNMTIGDRAGDVVLNDIDEKARRVKITYRGEELWLSMKDNGVPAPVGAPVAAIPAAPGAIPGVPGALPNPQMQPGGAVPVPLPGSVPSPNAMPASQPSLYPNAPGGSGRRVPRSGNANPAYNPSYVNPNVSFNSGGAAPVQGVPAQPQVPQPEVDIADQYVRMKLQEASGMAPPVPTL